MLTKNLTPFLFGAKVTSRKPPQPEMALIVRGTFAIRPGEPLAVVQGLEQGFLTAEVFPEGDEERLGECLYPGDFADFKLNAEVLLRGTCFAPGGKPTTECPVRFTVGAWSKILRVVGPRVWSDNLSGAVMSSPIAFTKMPLGYANSFGGPGYALNPAGKGHGTRELPTVEAAGQPIRSRADQPEPAGFGPLNPAWPQRSSKIGKEYGKSYKERRAPYYAEDFDWTYFHAAPADQQLRGYLRGDEEITLQNLHPTVQVLSTRLPGLRVRAFVKDKAQRFREVYMSLDTLFVDTDKNQLNLTWRGLDKVFEDDLSDVATVLIASEPLGAAPLREDHYQAQLEAFEQDPVGLKDVIPGELVEAGDRMKRERAGEILPPQGSAPPPDPVSAMLGQKLGTFDQAMQDRVRKAVGDIKSGPVGSKVDFESAVASASREAADRPPVPMPLKPGSLPATGLQKTIREVMAKVAEIKKTAAEKNLTIKGLDALEALPNDPRLAQLDPSYKPPRPISTEAPGPYKDLAEQDLSHRDLSGMDLRGANLEGATLTGANLRDANLSSANLKHAVLFKADVSGADLSGADLTKANAALLRAASANFQGATLDEAFFEDAVLTNATLTDARGEYVVLTRASLAGAKAQRVSLSQSDLSEATLEQANLSGASLAGCLFAKCRGKQLDLFGAKIGGASFVGADLRGARFAQARGERSYFMGANLDGADFSLASMQASHFTEASAVGARFFGANLRECRFYRAALDRAEIVRANLFSADLCKATMSGAKFTDSNLYDSKFLQASGAGCDFTGANLKRSTLERT